jgi:hypothetical protein
MAMAQQEMPDVAATEPDESRSTAAVLPLHRAPTPERLRRRLGGSSVDRRPLVLPKAIGIISDDLEANVTMLPLQNIARSRQEQSVTVANLVFAEEGVECRRTTIPLRQVAESLADILCGRTGTIVLPTCPGVSMVYGLEDVMADLNSVGGRVSQGDNINHRTNLLTLVPRSRPRARRNGQADRKPCNDRVRCRDCERAPRNQE